MTNQKAIEILTAKAECVRRETSGIDIDCKYRNCDECDLCYKQGTTGDQRKALSVAISALQAREEPKPPASGSVTCMFAKKMHDRPTDDCVSRQVAIDAVSDGILGEEESLVECVEECNAMIEWAVETLKKLPSAQPEIIHCRECKYKMLDASGDEWICSHTSNNAWRITADHYCGYAERREE